MGVLNWEILRAEKDWLFCVELMCWTEGFVELKETHLFSYNFLNNSKIISLFQKLPRVFFLFYFKPENKS